jgi:hypothetical protein
MSTYRLKSLLSPRSIALIGASPRRILSGALFWRIFVKRSSMVRSVS